MGTALDASGIDLERNTVLDQIDRRGHNTARVETGPATLPPSTFFVECVVQVLQRVRVLAYCGLPGIVLEHPPCNAQKVTHSTRLVVNAYHDAVAVSFPKLWLKKSRALGVPATIGVASDHGEPAPRESVVFVVVSNC